MKTADLNQIHFLDHACQTVLLELQFSKHTMYTTETFLCCQQNNHEMPQTITSGPLLSCNSIDITATPKLYY